MTNYYDKSGNRKLPYAEDSTKGGSIINPLEFKGDAVVQVWVDSRVLATLMKWLDKGKLPPRFMSDVVKESLTAMVDYLVNVKEVDMIENTMEARTLLETRFRINLNKGNRGRKNVLHNQVLSGKKGISSKLNFSEAQLEKAMRIMRELEEEGKDKD